MERKVRFTIGLVAVIMAAAALTGCGSRTSKEEVTLNVSYNLWVGSAGLFIAEEKGFFDDEGIKVNLKQFASPTEATQALLSGNVDVAATTLDTAVMVKSSEQTGKKLKVFSLTDLSNGADGIVAGKDIKSIADLKGKTVAATVGAVNNFLLDHALKMAGLTEKDIELSNVSPEQTGSLFLANKVDAAATWEPFLSEAVAKGGNLLFSTKEAPDLIVDGMMTSEELIGKQKEALRKMAAAIEKGTQFYYSNTDEAAEIVAKKLDTSKDEVIAMMDGVKLISQEEAKRMMTSDMDKLSSRTKEYSEFFFDHKLITNEVKPSDLFDTFLFQ